MVMEMRKEISLAASVVCPMCDKKECVGRYNCKQVADYLKTKLVDIDQFNRVEIDPFKKVPSVYTVELPVKLGQKVYTIPRSAIREWTVVGVWVSVDEKCSYVHIYWEKNGHHMESRAVNFSDLYKTVFLTREEAEAVLAKMDGERKDND
jgi:hypothetical protein